MAKLSLNEFFYFEMTKIRRAEEVICREYFKDSIRSPVHLCLGAESIAVGVLNSFSNRRIYGTYRNHHWYLAATQDFEGFWAELYAKEGSPNRGRAGSMHLCRPELGYILSSAVVSSTIPIAVGDAWANRNSNVQTICFFGDGATEEGVFWESLNMACLKKVPILFVCEDNGFSIHTPQEKRQRFKLSKLMEAFSGNYLNASALNIEDVASMSNQAKGLLKTGPVLLHFNYERMLEHVGTQEDYTSGYRVKPKGDPTTFDPLAFLKAKLPKDVSQRLETEAYEVVDKAWSEVQNRHSIKEKLQDSQVFKDFL